MEIIGESPILSMILERSTPVIVYLDGEAFSDAGDIQGIVKDAITLREESMDEEVVIQAATASLREETERRLAEIEAEAERRYRAAFDAAASSE